MSRYEYKFTQVTTSGETNHDNILSSKTDNVKKI